MIVDRINSDWNNNLLYNVSAPENERWFLSDFHFMAAINDLAGNYKVIGGRSSTAKSGACELYNKFKVNFE